MEGQSLIDFKEYLEYKIISCVRNDMVLPFDVINSMATLMREIKNNSEFISEDFKFTDLLLR